MTLAEVIDTLQTWIKNADDEYDREEMGRVAGLKEALHEIKKIEPCEDCISRQAAIDAIWDGVNMDIYTREVKECLEHLPSVSTKKAGHCKECKYFEHDSVAKVDGIPLIVAHEICSRWGNGCKTREDGYCFLFEPQESEDKK